METGPKGQLLLYFTFVCTTAGGILVPRPGIEPLPPAVEAQSPSKAPDHQGILLIEVGIVFPDVSVHFRGTCFHCTASTFTPRIHSHHGGTW